MFQVLELIWTEALPYRVVQSAVPSAGYCCFRVRLDPFLAAFLLIIYLTLSLFASVRTRGCTSGGMMDTNQSTPVRALFQHLSPLSAEF